MYRGPGITSTPPRVIYFTSEPLGRLSLRTPPACVCLARRPRSASVVVQDGDVMILTETIGGNVIQIVEPWQDVRGLPPDFKGKRTRRRPDLVTVLLVHQTAVKGGFGVTAKQVAEQPAHLPAEDRRQLARQVRYRESPYHGVYDAQARASIAQWPVWAYSHHGNGGNALSYGWAIDGLWSATHADDFDVDAARESMRHQIDCARRQGAKLACVESHAQHSATRGRDPGPEIWRGVVLPVAAECGLVVSMRTTGTGKIPTWQRPAPR
jgi:hypothetical protein